MSKNVNDLHNELLDNVSDSYQKTEGFPVWDILRAFAYGLKKLWDKAFEIEAELDVDNLKGEQLTRFVYQRKGVARKEATYAVGTISVVTGSGTITKGDLFATEAGVTFKATETKTVSEGSVIAVQAVNSGTEGNVASNTITQFPVTIAGISEITNETPTTDGYDEEADNDLRNRYYEALQEPATSGNVYHYKRWAKEVDGVGDAKVFSLWQGDNTVQVVIIDSNRVVPSTETVTRVQNYIDPGVAGSGEGEAPVGAYCTVTPATALPININVRVDLVNENGDVNTIKDEIETGVTEYLAEIAFKSNYVSIAKIGDIILDIDGVDDYSTLTVNGSTARLSIPTKSVAIMGTVTVNAS